MCVLDAFRLKPVNILNPQNPDDVSLVNEVLQKSLRLIREGHLETSEASGSRLVRREGQIKTRYQMKETEGGVKIIGFSTRRCRLRTTASRFDIYLPAQISQETILGMNSLNLAAIRPDASSNANPSRPLRREELQSISKDLT